MKWIALIVALALAGCGHKRTPGYISYTPSHEVGTKGQPEFNGLSSRPVLFLQAPGTKIKCWNEEALTWTTCKI
jgi:hypothetical protein